MNNNVIIKSKINNVSTFKHNSNGFLGCGKLGHFHCDDCSNVTPINLFPLITFSKQNVHPHSFLS
jgi:Fe2+ or Zn2+ uptake regulation protein